MLGIGRIDCTVTLPVDAVPKSGIRVIQRGDFDRYAIAEIQDFSRMHVVKLKIRLHDLHRNREIGVEHLIAQALTHGGPIGCNSTVDIKTISGNVGGTKEGEALDVIPVGMTKENMTFHRGLILQKMLTQNP